MCGVADISKGVVEVVVVAGQLGVVEVGLLGVGEIEEGQEGEEGEIEQKIEGFFHGFGTLDGLMMMIFDL